MKKLPINLLKPSTCNPQTNTGVMFQKRNKLQEIHDDRAEREHQKAYQRKLEAIKDIEYKQKRARESVEANMNKMRQKYAKNTLRYNQNLKRGILHK